MANEKKNTYEVKLTLNDISDNIKEEILEQLKHTRFNKISIPVFTYVESEDGKSRRTTVIGYIKRYNSETKTFVIGIYNSNKNTIAIGDSMDLSYSTYNDKLGTILKFIAY